MVEASKSLKGFLNALDGKGVNTMLNQHVIKRSEGWAVQGESSGRESSRHRTISTLVRLNSEQQAHEHIDTMLASSGSASQNYKAFDPNVGRDPGLRSRRVHKLTTFFKTNGLRLAEE